MATALKTPCLQRRLFKLPQAQYELVMAVDRHGPAPWQVRSATGYDAKGKTFHSQFAVLNAAIDKGFIIRKDDRLTVTPNVKALLA